ncbi:hypothetical protein [Rhodococcus jostii]|uniref:hypothetical protein n=1 Tax=Rhodococcus jostii TaxID=132919 RepID=UPI0009348701|nr:hypothetical protein [Rhodococcus jostii]
MPVKGSTAPSQGTGDAAVHGLDEVVAGGRIIDRVRIRKGRRPGPRRSGCGPSLGISDGILNAMTLAASTVLHGFAVLPYSGAARGNTAEITAVYTGFVTEPAQWRDTLACAVSTGRGLAWAAATSSPWPRVIAGFGSRSCAHLPHSPDLGRVAWGCFRSRPAAFWVGGWHRH